jgi:hypothetical protein
MIICRQHEVERSRTSDVESSATHTVDVRTGPHGSLCAVLTHTSTPVNAAVGRLVSAATSQARDVHVSRRAAVVVCVGAFQSRSGPHARTVTTGAWCPW